MKKKLLLAFALLVTAAIFSHAQYDLESHFTAEPIDGGRGVRITGYTGNNWTVRIPPNYRRIPVTEIGNSAFANNQLTSITIGANVVMGFQSFADSFISAYERGGRAAGTYTLSGGNWTRR